MKYAKVTRDIEVIGNPEDDAQTLACKTLAAAVIHRAFYDYIEIYFADPRNRGWWRGDYTKGKHYSISSPLQRTAHRIGNLKLNRWFREKELYTPPSNLYSWLHILAPERAAGSHQAINDQLSKILEGKVSLENYYTEGGEKRIKCTM